MGIRVNDVSLDDWPEEQVRKYQIVMRQVDVWEEAQMEIARRKAETTAGHR